MGIRITNKKYVFELSEYSIKKGEKTEKLINEYRATGSIKTLRQLAKLELSVFRSTRNYLQKEYPNISISKLRKIMKKTFIQMAKQYRPKDENSRFIGWLAHYYYKYALTNIRKECKRLRNISKFRSGAIRCFENAKTMQRFERILDNLGKRQRTVISFYYTDCLKIKNIAKKLSISPSTVRSTKMVALRKIKDQDPIIFKKLVNDSHKG